MKRLLLASLALSLTSITSLSPSLVGCGGAPIDRDGTLTRLQGAIEAEVSSATILEDHNQLVEDVSRGRVLEGMFQHELRARIGRGSDCGVSELCRRHGFRPSDWIYDVGRAPGDPALPAGPSLIVGFDSSGRVDATFYVTRRGAVVTPQ